MSAMRPPFRPRCRSWWPTIAGLSVALAGPPALAGLSLAVATGRQGLGLHALLQAVLCALAVLVLFVVVRWERLPLASVGLRRPGWMTFATAAGLIAATCFLLPLVTTPLIRALGQEGAATGVARLSALPSWFLLFAGTTAGAVEELLYRGYAMERLHAITGRLWLGAGIAAIAFGAAHIPFWGVGFSLAADLPFGVLMVFCYACRRDLLANMLAHSALATGALLRMSAAA